MMNIFVFQYLINFKLNGLRAQRIFNFFLARFFASGHNKLVSGLDNSLPPRGKKPAYEMMFSVSHDGTVRQWRYSLGHHISCKTTNALYTCNYNPRDPATSDTEVITAIKVSTD